MTGTDMDSLVEGINELQETAIMFGALPKDTTLSLATGLEPGVRLQDAFLFRCEINAPKRPGASRSVWWPLGATIEEAQETVSQQKALWGQWSSTLVERFGRVTREFERLSADRPLSIHAITEFGRSDFVLQVMRPRFPLEELVAQPDNVSGSADCYRCLDDRPYVERMFRGMIVCPECGNKRCPKASDHVLPCTGSNEPGQPGSVYGRGT